MFVKFLSDVLCRINSIDHFIDHFFKKWSILIYIFQGGSYFFNSLFVCACMRKYTCVYIKQTALNQGTKHVRISNLQGSWIMLVP